MKKRDKAENEDNAMDLVWYLMGEKKTTVVAINFSFFLFKS